MKINSIKIQQNNFKSFISHKHNNNVTIPVNQSYFPFTSFSGIQKANIDIQQLQKQEYFEEFMDRNGKVTPEEYEDIKKNHPSILLKAQKLIDMTYFGDTTPNEIARISLSTSDFLNNQFENYRIISLGTSPAPLAEQLMNLGHDVIFLPVSSIGCNNKTPEMNMVIKYLKSKNINDGKKNIIIDYVSSGQTLTTMKDVIEKKLKIDKKSIIALSVNNILKSLEHKTSVKIPYNYYNDMATCRVDRISNVPHFPVTKSGTIRYKNRNQEGTIYLEGQTKEELFKEFENYSSPLARCFSLCTLHEIDKLK